MARLYFFYDPILLGKFSYLDFNASPIVNSNEKIIGIYLKLTELCERRFGFMMTVRLSPHIGKIVKIVQYKQNNVKNTHYYDLFDFKGILKRLEACLQDNKQTIMEAA